MKRFCTACLLIFLFCETSLVVMPKSISTGIPLSLTEAETKELHISGGKLEIVFNPGKYPVPEEALLNWITSSAKAVTGYFGHFPVAYGKIEIKPVRYGGIRNGHAFGYGEPLIKISVGQQTQQSDLEQDWALTHEMVHLGFPCLPGRYSWIDEGMATYVEPLARTRIGLMSEEEYWKEMVEGLPKGLPQPGDQGLDYTPTWGRTYWGGALFCFLADLEIRQKSGNKYGLEDAFKGIVGHGGTITADWSIQQVIQAGDKATGLSVLNKLYLIHRATPVKVDLSHLWQQLGIQYDDGTVVFHDDAPLAWLRKALLKPPKKDKVTG